MVSLLYYYHYHLDESGSVSSFAVRGDEAVGRKRAEDHGSEGGGIDGDKVADRTRSEQELFLVSLPDLPILQDRRGERPLDQKENEENDNSSTPIIIDRVRALPHNSQR